MTQPSSSFVKILLHPATTITFGVVGVIFGLLAITRSGNETPTDPTPVATLAKRFATLEADYASLHSELSLLKTKDESLTTAVEELRVRLAAVEKRVPKPSTPKSRKSN